MQAHAQVDDRPFVLRDQAAGVLTLTLNRGDRFNPLSSAMLAAIAAELRAIAVDPSVRVVVVAGEGKGFCAGHDLKEMRAHVGDKAWQRDLFDQCGRMMMSLTTLPQPVVARVHGVATAAPRTPSGAVIRNCLRVFIGDSSMETGRGPFRLIPRLKARQDNARWARLSYSFDRSR